MEELLNEQASSSQQAIAQRINQSAKTSPFIIMMNEASPQDQFFVLEQFLEKITIKDPTTFYKNLSNMALKLKDSKPQTANPAEPKTSTKNVNPAQPTASTKQPAQPTQAPIRR
jgi:hypothetical protein